MATDFRQHLNQQINFIRNSCERYDQGDYQEAIRVAVALRVLFHDTTDKKGKPISISLLTHLGVKANLHIISTAEPNPATGGFQSNLTNIELSPQEQRAEFMPKLDNSTKKSVTFNDWWNREIVYFYDGKNIGRRSLILSPANQDGGAHVDITLPLEYQDAKNGLNWKMTLYPDSGGIIEVPFRNAHFSALR